jgi:hypothetical protein
LNQCTSLLQLSCACSLLSPSIACLHERLACLHPFATSTHNSSSSACTLSDLSTLCSPLLPPPQRIRPQRCLTSQSILNQRPPLSQLSCTVPVHCCCPHYLAFTNVLHTFIRVPHQPVPARHLPSHLLISAPLVHPSNRCK